MMQQRENRPLIDEAFWEHIADKSEELARLCRPHSKALTQIFEVAAWMALQRIEQKR
ncbi:MAG: hypothetical protein KF779_02595 [Hyphomonadaceae bacterium]|nr:hypothetical protein [Hyphomonadaceae bacterium]